MEINEELKAAKDVIQAFLKSKKVLRMYPQNNPIYIKTLEDSHNRFKEFFYFKDELNFKIRQLEILYGTDQVYHNPEKEDNLALFFFKDGLRDITFKKGLTTEEMEEFLKIISLDFDRDVVDDDIVTLFWEKDFQNIQYIVDETFLADEEDYENKAVSEVTEKETDPDNLMRAYQDAFKDEEEAKEVAIVPLSDKDLQLLYKQLEQDSMEKTDKLISILFELFYAGETKDDFSESVDFLNNSVEYSIRLGNIPLVIHVLTSLQQIIDNKNIGEDIKKHTRRALFFAGSDRIIGMIGELFDGGLEIEDKIFEDYVKFLDKTSIVPFMRILGELKTIHARKLVIDALVSIGPKDIMTLAKGLNDSRWYVVRNIIYILRKIGDKRAVDHLLKTVTHGDIRVKKEVIRTLGELGGAGVLVTLRDCLIDPDVQVRSAALKALGNIASEAAKRIILDKITAKEFKDKDFEEKKEYFEVLSHWKDSEIHTFLEKIIRKRVFFGRAKNFEIKACAAYCLGLIGNKDSLTLLSKHMNSGNKLFREFLVTAIKRIEHAR